MLPASGLVYLDTQVVVYTVEKHPVYGALLSPLWQAVQASKLDVVCSEVVILEALVGPLRTNNSQVASIYDQFFAQPGVRMMPISESILRDAARLRAARKLRTPDAIHVSTVVAIGADMFLTNDRSVPSRLNFRFGGMLFSRKACLTCVRMRRRNGISWDAIEATTYRRRTEIG